MLVQRDMRGHRSCCGKGQMSQLTPLSFPTASTKDVGASGRGEESSLSGLETSLPRLENSLVLSKLGEGAQAGEQLQQPRCGDASLCGHPERRWQ